MIAVIFEAWVPGEAQGEYLELAAELRPLLADIDGFISIERFQSLTTPGKVLSLSFWRDEAAIAQWRNLPEHRRVQAAGRDHVFTDYRLRIAAVARDYGLTSREEAPADSRLIHGGGSNPSTPGKHGHHRTACSSDVRMNCQGSEISLAGSSYGGTPLP